MTEASFGDEYIQIPFVLTQAHGGEYDTEAFHAGWTLGILDAKLSLASNTDLIAPPVVLKNKWKKQADLIAMSHSFLVRTIPTEDPDYSYFIFGTPEFFQEAED